MKRIGILLLGGGLLLLFTVMAAVWDTPPIGSAGPATITTGKLATVSTVLQKLDLNTATAAQLQEIPGIGSALAKRIVDERNRSGGFADLYDLTAIEGIRKEMVRTWEQYLTVSDE